MDRRHEFLDQFLGALGAQEIRYLLTTPDFIAGTVVYDPSDPQEQQAFRWSIRPDDAPSPAVIRLVGLIRSDGLLRSDKLLVSRHELLARFNVHQSSACSLEQFTTTLEELLQVQVPMLDDDVETDYYFIHE